LIVIPISNSLASITASLVTLVIVQLDMIS
jgi:hypothetical protein